MDMTHRKMVVYGGAGDEIKEMSKQTMQESGRVGPMTITYHEVKNTTNTTLST